MTKSGAVNIRIKEEANPRELEILGELITALRREVENPDALGMPVHSPSSFYVVRVDGDRFDGWVAEPVDELDEVVEDDEEALDLGELTGDNLGMALAIFLNAAGRDDLAGAVMASEMSSRALAEGQKAKLVEKVKEARERVKKGTTDEGK